MTIFTPMPKLLSIQIAMPQDYGREDAADLLERPWRSGFFKQVVTGPIKILPTLLEGDGQADLINHGGVDKSICCYAAEHFPFWQTHAGLEKMGPGGFGENFSFEGLLESEICIGDIYRIGNATLQISQPREPCSKLARRWLIKQLPAWVIQNGRTGWYFRVVETGIVEAGNEVTLLERPNPEWSVARANEIAHHRKTDSAARAELASVPYLSEAWRIALSAKV
jgi:MOSC domain-containing protein YiiM